MNPERSPRISQREWAVKEIKEKYPEFLGAIQKLHDGVLNSIEVVSENERPENERPEIVITLYTRIKGEHGVGQFEYDLVYHRNLHDDSPMFGPIVKNDDRTKFINSINEIRDVNFIGINGGKSGGFIKREGILSSARFKLGGKDEFSIWRNASNADAIVEPDKILGLLFINGRNIPIQEPIFREISFIKLLIEIEEIIENIAKDREQEALKKRGLLYDELGDIFTPDLISAANTNLYISKLINVVIKKINAQDVAFSIYLFIDNESKNKKRLKWLWSNTPTSTHETIKLSKSENSDDLLIVDVACDPNNKPLLIHRLQEKPNYRKKAIRTGIAGSSGANLIVPILHSSNDRDAKLIGIFDLQSIKSDQFDADDVQLLYSFVRLSGLGSYLNKIRKSPDSLPLHTVESYNPFEKKELRLNVDGLLSLNFNPMKFLLHWPKIRELITTNKTESPSTIEVWPNMICNHHCTWCRTEKDRKLRLNKKQEMTHDELVGIGNDINENLNEVDVLISGGGEPLLHSGMYEFIKAINEIDGTIGIFTNGTRPHDFRFWEEYFKREDRHRFVRVSFNGHDPNSYYRVHFDAEKLKKLPRRFSDKYAETRKVLMDLLHMRSSFASVSIGDTVREIDLQYINQKAVHADNIGVDFIQMRPELLESAHSPEIGISVCNRVQELREDFSTENNFSIVHTDGERSFLNHDEPFCYAMYLVPTLVPDSEYGWTRIMPCSYAINQWGKVPDLGRMREGAKFSEFWRRMNSKLNGVNESDDSIYEVKISSMINPSKNCPQCRYFRLNKRIEAIKTQNNSVSLIDALVSALGKYPEESLDTELCNQIQELFGKDDPQWGKVIDVELAKDVFIKSRNLGIVPSF